MSLLADAHLLAVSAAEDAVEQVQRIADDAHALLVFLLEWGGLVAALVVLVRLGRLRRRRHLVVGGFANTSGVAELDSPVQGLGELLRERLVDQLGDTRRHLRESAGRTGLPASVSVERAPVPVGEADVKLSELVASLKASVPAGVAPSVTAMTEILFRPAGTRVSGTVQCRGSGTFGITVEMVDLRGARQPSIHTLWQARAAPETSGDDPRDGLLALLDAVARLVARRIVLIELTETGGRRHRWGRRSSRRHEALVHNFVGMLLQGDGLAFATQGLAPFFLAQAIKEFDRAAELAPDLYQPYENLADTRAMQVQLAGDPFARGVRESIRDYELALERARALPEGSARSQVLDRIGLALVLVERRSDDPAALAGMLDRVSELERAAETEMDDEFLYNLACWFGLDHNLRCRAVALQVRRTWLRHIRTAPLPVPGTETKMLRYLGFCFARSITAERAAARAAAARHDSDLSLVHGAVSSLHDAVAREVQRDPGLRTTASATSAAAIDRIIDELPRTHGRERSARTQAALHRPGKVSK